MKRLAVLTLLLSAAPAWAQYWGQLHTDAVVPPREVLDRLNLQVAWSTSIPTESRRDGLYSVQVFDDQILVQSRSGMVTAVRVDDGSIQWNVLAGVPYRVTQLLGRNADSVFVYNGTHLIALARDNGALRFTFNLSAAPSAPPVAEKDRIYVSLSGGKFFVFRLPDMPKVMPVYKGTTSRRTVAAAAPSPVDFLAGSMGFSEPPITGDEWSNRGPQPELLWEYRADTRLEQAPLLAEEVLLLAGFDGTFLCASKDLRQVLYRFRAHAPLAAPLGQYDTMAYVASTEYDVYALEMLSGKITWHYVSGTPILRKPEVNDDDVFIAPKRPNLARVNRETGERIWTNQKADRFIAANKKFVYAADPNGRLLILDKKYGTVLSALDTRDFVVPVANELTDRIYLAANNGLLVCLHDKEYAKPLVMKHVKGPAAPGPKPKPVAKPAEAPKEKAEEKEKEKEKEK